MLPSWTPLAAGLVVSACFAWWVRPLPGAFFLSWSALATSAANYTLSVSLVAAAAAWAASVVMRRGQTRGAGLLLHDTLPALAVTAWLAPAALWLSEGSPWASVATIVLAASLTRAFFSLHATPLEDSKARHFLQVPGAAVSLEAGMLACGLGRAFPAAALLATATVCLVSSFAAHDLLPQPVWPYRRFLHGSFAFLLTVAGLTRFILPGAGVSPVSNNWFVELFLRPRVSGGELEAAAKQAESKKRIMSSATAPAAEDPREAHTGIILLPETQTVTTLVPPIPVLRSNLFSSSGSLPLQVPFFGAYWYFRFPEQRPPEDSRTLRGDPATLRFLSTDRRAMIMEAHQNFGRLIDLSCCREIQLVLRNADRYPGTVSVGLILVNTELENRPSQTLPRVPVKATLPDDRPPVEEVLTFPIPKVAAIRQFDHVTVRFYLQYSRSNRSARMAVDRFVFIPRRN